MRTKREGRERGREREGERERRERKRKRREGGEQGGHLHDKHELIQVPRARGVQFCSRPRSVRKNSCGENPLQRYRNSDMSAK